jgi:short-subunit dehydrogenase
MSFSNILITGASSGIGAALATQLALPSRTLGLMGLGAESLNDVAEKCLQNGAQCQARTIDICDRDSVSAFVRDFDREHAIDLMVVNAGVLLGRSADQVVEDKEAALRVLNTNLLAAINCIHLVLPQMLERGHGTLVIVASISAYFPLPDASAYSASKAGLLSYGLALREAVRQRGVKVVVACPGYVATPMLAKHHGLRFGEMSADQAAAHILKRLPRYPAVIGFPAALFWMARASILFPDFMRRKAMSLLRFDIG